MMQIPEGFTDLPISDTKLKEIGPIVYDELIAGCIKLIQKLDLSYSLESDPSTPSGSMTESKLKPTNAKDLEVFNYLVGFCTDVLPNTLTECFSRWVYIFGKELISLSNEFPLVGGFYKLLTVTMKVCEKLSYFDALEKSNQVIELIIYQTYLYRPQKMSCRKIKMIMSKLATLYFRNL
jgi:hypothetical protein